MKMSGTKSDNELQQVTANGNNWPFRLNLFFCRQYSAGMNILKTKRPFPVTPEVIANNSSRCT